MRETYLEIDISKIRKNIINIKKNTDNCLYCAVVKADAYGLGAINISKNIEDIVDYFAVARSFEAFDLRKAGIKKPILILGYTPLSDIKRCSDLSIDITIYDLKIAEKINSLNYSLNCHIALDTGHSRLGFRDFEIEQIKALKTLDRLHFISCFTHFSRSDEKDQSFTKEQVAKFNYILDQIRDDFSFEFIHADNSASTLLEGGFEKLLRVGISTYGIYPSDFIMKESKIGLYKSFRLFATVSFVKNIKENTPISYGSTFISDKPMKVATVTIGYADGYPRSLSNKGFVHIKDNPCKVLGRVCMDQIIVDVSGIDVRVGDRVEIYKDLYIDAEKAYTISYELMTGISKRVQRVYKNCKLPAES